MSAFYRSIDTILWGRKTYDMVLKFQKQGIKGAEFDAKIQNYIFSRRAPRRKPPAVEFVAETISAFVRRLRKTPGKNIWMMGGAKLIGSFLDAGQLDEFIIHVIPVFIGDGIPLIAPRQRTVELTLRSCRSYPDGVMRLHYVVKKGRRRQP
jgi:dihydrofolate reductase